MRWLLWIGVIALAGCAGYHQRMECQAKIGPEPYAGSHAFGLIGAVIRADQPEWREWDRQVNDCIRVKKAAS